jgi:hypothetical protein
VPQEVKVLPWRAYTGCLAIRPNRLPTLPRISSLGTRAWASRIHRLFIGQGTPPDPRSGATLIVLDPLEWIHRITAHVPEPGQHTRRSYGAYCNRARVTANAAQVNSDNAAPSRSAGEDSEFARETRRTWARLLTKIFEVDPLLCSCGAELRIVSVITQPRIVDRILRHFRNERRQARDPFQSRAPPRTAALFPP